MITTLTGSNSFLLKVELKRLVDDFVNEHGDMALERIDGEEAAYDRIREALESLPFLANKKLVVLRNPSANKEFTEKAEDLLANTSEETDVIIVEPKLDKRSTYYKFLQKKTDYKQFDELDERGLTSWLVDQVKEQKGDMNTQDAHYLIERVGADQQLLSQEINKLMLYSPHITRQVIEELTEPTPQSTIFELLDAAFAGHAKRAIELYHEQRVLKVEPIQIIAMLAWQLHTLAVIKSAGNKDSGAVAQEARINPFVLRKSQNIARKLTLAELKSLIKDVLELDIRMKSESIDADDAIQDLLITISNK